jgi:hypothetical protein
MRRILIALTLSLPLLFAAAALAQEPVQPKLDDVQAYARLFGYRQMLAQGVNRQLDALAEYYKAERPDVPPATLNAIFEELRAELDPGLDTAMLDMAKVFQRHLTQADVDYLLRVGRDPRMQKVIQLQTSIARDLEYIGDNLAESLVAKAAPRIEERLSGNLRSRAQ